METRLRRPTMVEYQVGASSAPSLGELGPGLYAAVQGGRAEEVTSQIYQTVGCLTCQWNQRMCGKQLVSRVQRQQHVLAGETRGFTVCSRPYACPGTTCCVHVLFRAVHVQLLTKA
jgi:hypothetical protein